MSDIRYWRSIKQTRRPVNSSGVVWSHAFCVYGNSDPVEGLKLLIRALNTNAEISVGKVGEMENYSNFGVYLIGSCSLMFDKNTQSYLVGKERIPGPDISLSDLVQDYYELAPANKSTHTESFIKPIKIVGAWINTRVINQINQLLLSTNDADLIKVQEIKQKLDDFIDLLRPNITPKFID